ncbi:MAG: DUF4440 domain-containing protein [Beijerinckiaceae bacterium]
MFRRSLMLAAAFVTLAGATYAEDAKQVSQALADSWVQAYNSNMPMGVAALFTNDAPFIGPPGVLKGPANIEKAIAARMKAGWTTETLRIKEAHAVGDGVWSTGEFQFTGSGEQAGKTQSGNFGWVLVKDGGDWHITMLVAAPSAAPPPPK